MNQENAFELYDDAALKYYPISLNVTAKNCLVVGGGSVGLRKALTLARCRAKVNVVSPDFSDEFIQKAALYDNIKTEQIKSSNSCNNIVEYQRNGVIRCIKKSYDINDLESIFLVIGATDNMAVNRQIAADAHARQILCNIADFPEGSSFILPSIVQRGDLVITVSTSGNSPAFANKLKKELELQFGQEYASFLEIIGAVRKQLLSHKNLQNPLHNNSLNNYASIFRDIVDSDLLKKVLVRDLEGVGRTLKSILGKYGYSHLYPVNLYPKIISRGE